MTFLIIRAEPLGAMGHQLISMHFRKQIRH